MRYFAVEHCNNLGAAERMLWERFKAAADRPAEYDAWNAALVSVQEARARYRHSVSMECEPWFDSSAFSA